MIPITSIATIDDLIVNLIRLGYKKSYDEYQEGRVYSWGTREERIESYRNCFHVWRLPHENIVRVFIHYKTPYPLCVHLDFELNTFYLYA